MHVTLVRHGAAGSASRDELRPLTPAGEEEARALGAALARRGLRFDRVVGSPLLRARQTARIVLDAMGTRIGIEEDARLTPEAAPEAAVDLLAAAARVGTREIALVAHMPIVAGIAELLLHRRVPGFRTGQGLRIHYVEAAHARAAAASAVLDWLPAPVSGQD